jgi:hypothetical protein
MNLDSSFKSEAFARAPNLCEQMLKNFWSNGGCDVGVVLLLFQHRHVKDVSMTAYA